MTLALTVLPLMSLCRPQHAAIAGVPRAPARHVVTPACPSTLLGWWGYRIRRTPISRSPFEEENNPPEFMRGKEVLWTEAGQISWSGRAKSSHNLCVGDPHVKTDPGRIILLSWG